MSNDERLREYLKQVTVDLHETRLRLREAQQGRGEPLAIVGMACRYPGGVRSPEGLWEMVDEGREGISELPTNRGWDLEQLREADRDGTVRVWAGGFLHDVAEFDADFFGISPNEARAMDPQQRLLLEVCWEALEAAGIDPTRLSGSQTSAFVGGTSDGYGLGASSGGEEQQASGHLASLLSGRISYALGLEGPSLTVDTACSSSLVALHLACASLRARESSLALVGGVNVMPTPAPLIELARQRGLARDGRCKSFAEDADGTSWSEGAGMLVLERFSDAERLDHRVLAVVRGSAVNQDGASNGLLAPNGQAQQRVIHRALANAALAAHEVDAVEAHGTGTVLGDPIEAQALLATYGRARPDGPLWLGSIKSNIGHPQAAAGVAAVIKMVMALVHERLPRTLHAERASGHVDWSAGAVSLLNEAQPWPRGGRPRRAGVSSFGASGTNAHVIVEEAPPGPAATASVGERMPAATAPVSERMPAATAPVGGRAADPTLGLAGQASPLLLSARGELALARQASRLAELIDGMREPAPLARIATSLARRPQLGSRAAIVAGDTDELARALGALASDGSDPILLRGEPPSSGVGGIVFVFPGQGSQWPGMATDLLERSPLFARHLRECGAALEPHTGWSLAQALAGEAGAPPLERVDVVQPALFAVMVALAQLWRACGVQPHAVLGHSQGEIAAACVAGALSLEDAARIVALRGRALLALSGLGGMASIAAPVEDVQSRLGRMGGSLSVAAVNGPCSVVVSGEPQALRRLMDDCAQDGLKARSVPVDYAAHSEQVERIEGELLDGCAEVTPREALVPFHSAVIGGALDGRELDARYWYRNLRDTVCFQQAAHALIESGHRAFVEISPHPVLSLALHEIAEQAPATGPAMPATGPAAPATGPAMPASSPAAPTPSVASAVTVLGTLRRGDGGARRFLTSLGEAWARGVEVGWDRVLGESGAEPLDLPTYAFQRRRYWLDDPIGAVSDPGSAGQAAAGHPLLSACLPQADGAGWVFTGRVSTRSQPWLDDHVLAGMVVVPGTTHVELALRAGAQVGCETVEDLVHEAPLVLSGDDAVQLQVLLGAADERGHRQVAVFTRPERSGGDAARDDGEGWTRHARGMLAPAGALGERTVELQREAGALAEQSWPPAGAEPVPIEELYDYFAGLGLDYGPAFLSVRAAWRRGEEMLTEVRLPEHEHARARQFNIHPALLDATIQAGGLHVLATGGDRVRRVSLPFAWTGVSLLGAGATGVRVRSRRLADGGMSLLTVDERGRPVAAVDAFHMREVSHEQLNVLRAARGGDDLLALEWTALSTEGLTAAAASIAEHGMVLAGSQDMAPAGSSQDMAPAGSQDMAPAGSSQDMAPAGPKGVEAGIAAVDADATPPLALARFDAASCGQDEDAVVAMRRVTAEGLALIQRWLADERLAGSCLAFATSGALSVGEGDLVTDVPGAALWGLVRSAQSEHPGRFLLIDADDVDGSLAGAAMALAAREPQVALREGRLLAARIGRVGADENAVAPPPIGLTADGEPGTVLITGGTGALGSLVARHLVANHGVLSLLLASRSGPLAPGVERLEQELTDLGAQVTIRACDVSDRQQLAQTLAAIPEERPLSAVLHAAGALDDGVVESLTAERVAGVLAPKSEAAWHLHELTAGMSLSAFILFSSSTGTLGGPGQANYAAANAVLDSLAAYRRGCGLPASSLAWGWWAAADGLAGDLSAVDRLRMQRGGMLPLSAEQGVALLDAAYARGRALVMPVRVDWSALRGQARGGELPRLLQGLVRTSPQEEHAARGSLARRLERAAESERARVAVDLVRAEVASVLGHSSPEDVNAERAFSELGFDSLAAVELRNRLSVAGDVQLPATLIFDHPTPAAVAKLLLAELSPRLAGARGEERGPQDGEAQIRDAIAAIPLGRLREAGLMEPLLRLAGIGEEQPQESADVEEIDELDIESLVEMTLASEQAEEGSGA